MRLKCDVTITPVSQALSTNQKAAKPSPGSVYLGTDMKSGPINLMVASKTIPKGVSFMVKDNVEKVFETAINSGKATIQFKDPEKYVLISNADVPLLKNFVKTFKETVIGNNPTEAAGVCLKPVKAKHLDPVKSNLIITCRNEYPFSAGFPMHLTSLQANNCAFNTIDPRMLALRNLVTLDLSHNLFHKVIGDLNLSRLSQLRELRLTNNQLTVLPDSFVTNLPATITWLQLNQNKLARIPRALLARLPRLMTLDFSDNPDLRALPDRFGHVTGLRTLLIGRCGRVNELPGSILQLRLQKIDVSHVGALRRPILNPFRRLQSGVGLSNGAVPTLQALAAKTILENGIPLDDLPKALIAYVRSDAFVPCNICAAICLPEPQRFLSPVNLRKLATEVVLAQGDLSTKVPVVGAICSDRCGDAYKSRAQSLG